MGSHRSVIGLVAGGVVLAAAVGSLFYFGSPTNAAPEVSGPEIHRTESAPAAETAHTREAAPEARLVGAPPPKVEASTGEPQDERLRRSHFGLKGRVLKANREPVADLAVEVFLGQQTMFMPSLEGLFSEPITPPLRAGKTRTDSGGSFLIPGLPSRRLGLLSLGAHTAQATFRILDRTPEPGETLDLGDLLLVEGTTLSGTVVDDAGTAVVGARVRVAEFPAIAFQFGAAWLDGEGGLLIADGRGRSSAEQQVFPFTRWMTELEKDLPLPETFTDEAGQFRLAGMPAGKPNLWIQKRGLMPLTHGPVAAEAGKERALGRLVMKRGEAVTGTVVDGVGKGVVGAQVMVGAPALGGFPLTFLRSVAPSDQSGHFTIDATGRDKLVLAARRGPGEAWVVVGPVDPSDDLVIKLEEPGLLRVFVANEQGAALDGAELRATPDHEMFQIGGLVPSLPLAQRTQRAEDGSYLLRNLRPGKLRIQARRKGYVPSDGRVAVTGTGEAQLRLSLVPAAEGRVRVEDPGGQPVALARVFVKAESFGKEFLRGGIPVQLGITDPSGEVVVTELPAGTHSLWVMHPEFGRGKGSITLPGATAVVRMVQAGSIVGVLTRGGVPPGDSYAIMLMQDWNDRNPADELPTFTWSLPDGNFRFASVPPGRYRVHPQLRLSTAGNVGDVVRIGQSMDDLWNTNTEAVVVGGQECQVRLDIKVEDPTQVGRVAGVVMRNGRPAEGLYVNAWSGKSKRTQTDATGRFELEGLRPGDAWINIGEPTESGQDSRQIAQRSVKVKVGETVEIRVDVTTGHLRGRVVMPDGAPSAETRVSLQGQAEGVDPARGNGQVYYSTNTDATGAFALRDLVAGSYEITVQKPGFVIPGVSKAKVRSGEETSDLLIRLAGAVQFGGRVVVEGGLGGKDHCWIMIRPKDASESDPIRVWASVNSEGKFEPVDMAPGAYRARLNKGGESFRETEFTVAGARLDAVLEFVKAEPAKK